MIVSLKTVARKRRAQEISRLSSTDAGSRLFATIPERVLASLFSFPFQLLSDFSDSFLHGKLLEKDCGFSS